MKAILVLMVFEWKALIKGLLVVFMIIFPFTFLPILFSKGFDSGALIDHLPGAALFTLVFSLFVLGVALINNIKSLHLRKKIFDSPAFRSLNFLPRFLGSGSITKDLESILIGKLDKYFFRLRIENPKDEKCVLEIVPLIEYNDRLKKCLISEHLFYESENEFLGYYKEINKAELEVEDLVSEILREIEYILQEYKAVSLGLEEIDLLQ